MIKSFGIQNYKSILDHTIDLGRLNVFIGENGSGKTNILEAMAVAATVAGGQKPEVEVLHSRGVRVAKPSLTFSSFLGRKQIEEAEFVCGFSTGAGKSRGIKFVVSAKAKSEIDADWFAAVTRPSLPVKKADDSAVVERIKEVRDGIRGAAALGKKGLFLEIERQAALLLDPELASLFESDLDQFIIYNLNPLALRGLQAVSLKSPLGVNGESLDVFISTFNKAEMADLIARARMVSWVDNVVVDVADKLKFKGYKPGRSASILYFRDRFMRRGNNLFSAENANDGILHVLFYLALFMSDRTPRVFGIDNIETALNPQMCRELIKELAALAKRHGKQALITTHNPAILDGLNLHDDEQRLFVVSRNDHGHTVTERIKVKPQPQGEKYKLSELWMRGHLGGLPHRF